MPNKKSNVIWLCQANFSAGLESLLTKQLLNAGLADAPIKLLSLTNNCLVKQTKTKFTWDQTKYAAFEQTLLSKNPDMIVCNDKAALGFLTQKYISLALTRGSVYTWHDIPVLIIDEVRKTKSTNQGEWILKQDLAKLKRWINGTQRHQPKFSYTVTESQMDLRDAYNAAKNSILIGTDIETSGQGRNCLITCSGYTTWEKSGKVHTYVIPFVDTTQSDGCFWREQVEEMNALKTMKEIHATPAKKILQNGSYDSAHVLTYHMPYNNYCLDTLHLWHSVWAESPKKLDFIASICLDFYRYWKDESKEDEKNDTQKTKVPQTADGLRAYWRYNALDCYYTTMCALYLSQLYSVPQLAWAKTNYVKEIRQQLGPCLAGSMRGVKWNKQIQQDFEINLTMESLQAHDDLKLMVADPDFNPNSPPQVKQLVYGMLQATPLPRKGQTTDQTILKLIQTQHPLTRRIIEQLWKVKKPKNNAAKYRQEVMLNGRFMYKISAAGTETARQATKQSDFWKGSNVQNIPEPMRIAYEADPGYFLFDFDYSQSDAYFTAFESEDQKYMHTMLSPDDTHCIHAAHFFKRTYDELIAAKRNHEDWCTHKVTGVRSVTKRAVYGANYMMSAYTLFITMGQEAVIAAGLQLGYKDAGSWSLEQLVFLCGKLIEAYFELYPCLQPWLVEEITRAVAKGNLVTCFGGTTRLFFGDLNRDKAAQREMAAFYGQGGTAGNINAFLDDFFFDDGMFKQNEVALTDSSDIMFLFQVHDSVVGQVRQDKVHLLKSLKLQMERDCTIHGRTFKVPVEGQVGVGWGKRMVDWHEDITKEDILKYESQWWETYRGEK